MRLRANASGSATGRVIVATSVLAPASACVERPPALRATDMTMTTIPPDMGKKALPHATVVPAFVPYAPPLDSATGACLLAKACGARNPNDPPGARSSSTRPPSVTDADPQEPAW